MSTITILLKQNEERVICSFSCVIDINLNKNVVGEGYMGVAQASSGLLIRNSLHDYVEKNKTIHGFNCPAPEFKQFGFLFDDRHEVYHGNKCIDYYGHFASKDLLVIGNIVKSNELLLNLFNDLNNSVGTINDRIVESLFKNKVVGFDSRCERYGLSSSAISFMKYNDKGDRTFLEYYCGTSMDPIDYLYNKLKAVK
jgi:hypothetical protein